MCVFVLCVFSSVEGGKRIKGAESFFSIVFVSSSSRSSCACAFYSFDLCLCVLDEPIHKAAKKKR